MTHHIAKAATPFLQTMECTQKVHLGWMSKEHFKLHFIMPSRNVCTLVMILLRINMLTLVYSLSFMHKAFPFFPSQESKKGHRKACAGNIDSHNNLVWKELLKSSCLLSGSELGKSKVKSGCLGSCLAKF